MMNLLKPPAFVLCAALATGAWAQDTMIDSFDPQSETTWRFFSDQVMGGVSSGQAQLGQDGADSYVRMTGTVSTANNGGFIQIRTDLQDGLPPGTRGLRLVVRGNNQQYFVHLRTTGTALPWQYYQAGFDVSTTWTEVKLPLNAFNPSGAMLRDVPLANTVTSVGIVAYGRDHAAQIDVKEIGFY
ncbi:MAG: CIA30 family protein [Roseovarius sp.]